jgi:hypothetical protein
VGAEKTGWHYKRIVISIGCKYPEMDDYLDWAKGLSETTKLRACAKIT